MLKKQSMGLESLPKAQQVFEPECPWELHLEYALYQRDGQFASHDRVK
jgi:hypothetical protein